MSDERADLPYPEENKENMLFTEQFDEFREAVEVLYIIANQSGRILFAKSWPEGADFILGQELVGFDTKGTQDLERRSELEAQAEHRRLELLEIFDNIEENSVIEGVLQVEYVQSQIQDWGRTFSLLVFSQTLVDRFAPEPVKASEPEVSPVSIEGPSVPSTDSGSVVKPIETSPPSISTKPLTAAEVKPAESEDDPVADEADVVLDEKPAFQPKSTGKKSMKFVSSKGAKKTDHSG